MSLILQTFIIWNCLSWLVESEIPRGWNNLFWMSLLLFICSFRVMVNEFDIFLGPAMWIAFAMAMLLYSMVAWHFSPIIFCSCFKQHSVWTQSCMADFNFVFMRCANHFKLLKCLFTTMNKPSSFTKHCVDYPAIQKHQMTSNDWLAVRSA